MMRGKYFAMPRLIVVGTLCILAGAVFLFRTLPDAVNLDRMIPPKVEQVFTVAELLGQTSKIRAKVRGTFDLDHVLEEKEYTKWY